MADEEKSRERRLLSTLGDVGQAVRDGGLGRVIRRLLGSGPTEPLPEAGERAAGTATQREQELEAEVERLRKQLEETKLELVGRTASLKNEIFDLKKRNNELLEKVVSLTQKERALSKQVLDAQFAGSGHKADKERLEIELRDVKRDLAEEQARRQEAEERAARAEQELAVLREQVADQSGPAGETRSSEVAEVEEALERAQRRAAELERALERERERARELEADRRQLEERISALEGEVGRLRAELEAARADGERRQRLAGEPGPVWEAWDSSWRAVESALGELRAAVGLAETRPDVGGEDRGAAEH